MTTFDATPEEVRQPALLDDIVCLHLGGAKRVHRSRDGRRTVHDVSLGSLTIIPKGRAATWVTEGPIAYAHLTLNPKAFDDVATAECGRTRAEVELCDHVGLDHPLLSGLADEMLRITMAGGESRLYVETVFTGFVLALLRHATPPAAPALADAENRHCGGLAPWRLRAVLEYIEAHRTSDIGLEQLTGIASLSRAHFFRAFRQSTGTTPGRYLEGLRVGDARRAIEHGEPLTIAASESGFTSVPAMTRAFRRTLNTTPEMYRRWYR